MANWTKLKSGDWGVTVDGSISVGQTVDVKTKAGKVERVTITRIVWTGNGKSICAVSKPQTSRGSSNADNGWRGNGCSACKALGDWCDRCRFDEFDM